MFGVKYLILRGGVYCYRRKVPTNLADIEPRKFIKVSLKTDDLNEAILRISKVDKETEKYFDTLALKGVSDTSKERYEKAIARAQCFGLVYREAEQIAEGPIEDLQNRLDLAEKHIDNPAVIEAVLGGVKKPTIKLSAVPELYFEIAKGEVRDKNEVQTRIWRNSRLRAVRNFVSVAGDKDVVNLDRDDSLAFRDFWLDRITDEDMAPGTANKEFGHIDRMLKVVCDHYRLPYTPLFVGLRFTGQTTKMQRLPFTTEFILKNLLADNALEGMFEAGKALIHLMADNGARPSELVGLDIENELYLDHNVPYFHIRSNKYRSIKNKNSEREIPLVGYSLEAAQKGAFEKINKYRDNSISLTNIIGIYFRNNKYLPSKQYSLYSLRHSFDDRMTAAEVPERLQSQLMGHEYHRPSYGLGGDLLKKQEWLLKCAL